MSTENTVRAFLAATYPAYRAYGCLLGSLMALGGCAQVLDLDPDPQLDEGPWRCLTDSGERWDDPPVPEKSTALVRVLACDLTTECASRPDLEVKICGRRDEDCLMPLDTEIKWVDNEFRFEVPTGMTGFAGYFQLTAPLANCNDEEAFGDAAGPEMCRWCPEPSMDDEREDVDGEETGTEEEEGCQLPLYLTQRYFLNPPVVADMDQPLQIYVVATPTALAEQEAAGVKLDRNKAIVVALARDCDGKPAPDVMFKADQDADFLLQRGGVLTKSDNASDVTDPSGAALFSNVVPGSVVVRGFDPSDRRYGEVGISVKPFAINVSPVVPSRY